MLFFTSGSKVNWMCVGKGAGMWLAACCMFAMSFAFDVHAGQTEDAKAYSIFEQFNTYDIELAAFAVTRGQSGTVRAVGEMILKDHVPLLEDIRELAGKGAVTYSIDHENDLGRKHKNAVLTLMDKDVDEFDKTYLIYEQDFSKMFVRVIQNEIIPDVNDAEAEAFFTKILARFNEHLAHINHAANMVSEPDKIRGGGCTGHDHDH